MAIAINQWADKAWIDYVARREGHTAVPTLLLSKPGEAKSSFVEGPLLASLEAKLFPNLKVDLAELPDVLRGHHVHFSPNGAVACLTDLAAMRDAPDYKGFLVPKKDGTSGYTMADLVAKERMLYDLGVGMVVLFLDEVLLSDHLTQKALTDVFLNGRFGDYSLRKETWVIGASNRLKDGAGVNRTLTILQNRLNAIEVYLPVDTWESYAKTVLKAPPLMLTFAKQFPGKISIDQPPKEGPFPSWRSFTYLTEWVKAYKEHEGTADTLDLPFSNSAEHAYVMEKAAGFVGQGLLTEIAAFAKVVNELPTKEEIIKDPERAKVPQPGRLDAAYAATQMLVYYANGKNIEQFWQYAERLPKELQVATARDLLQKDNSGGGLFLNNQRFNDWIGRNRTLIRESMM